MAARNLGGNEAERPSGGMLHAPKPTWRSLRPKVARAIAGAWVDRRKTGVDPSVFVLIVLASVPIFAALFSRLRLGPVGIDPWLYYAYGTNLEPLLARFGWTYYASRLPWNIIISLYFMVFSPSVALFLLGLTVSCLGSLSLYAILRHYYSEVAAFLTAFAFASNSWYLGDTFWLYVDGPAIALSLFSIASFLHGLRSFRPLAFCLSGFAFTIGANAHPIVLLLVLPGLCLILIAERAICSRWAWKGTGAFCATVIGTMLALCTTVWLVFGNFWFFAATISVTTWVVSGGWHHWVIPFSTWIRGATAFFMPIGVLLAGTIVFGREAWRRQVKSDVWIFLYAVVLGLCFIVSDVFMNGGRLQHTYYFIYLWIPTFLLLGSINARLIDAAGAPATAVVGTGIVSLGTLALGGEYWQLHLVHPMRLMLAAYVVIAALTLTFIGAILLPRSRSGVVQVGGVIAGAALISISCAVDERLSQSAAIPTPRLLWQTNSTWPDFTTTVDAQRFINMNLDVGRKLLIWYNANSSLHQELTAINSTFLYEYSLLNLSMPELADADLEKLKVPASVVLLSGDTQEAARALGVLQKKGVVERLAAKTVIGQAGKQINIWIVDTKPTIDTSRPLSSNSLPSDNASSDQIVRPLPIDWEHVTKGIDEASGEGQTVMTEASGGTNPVACSQILHIGDNDC